MRNRTLGVLGVVAVLAAGEYVAACGGSSNKGEGSEEAGLGADGSGGEDSAQTVPEGSAGDGSMGSPGGDAQSASDAPSNSDSTTAVEDASDGGVEAAAPCNASKAFAAVGEVTSLDVVADAAGISARGARLGPDLSTMYFGWNDVLYTGNGAQTQSVNATFTGLAPIPVLTDVADGATLAQNEPTLTPDGLTLYYANNGHDIWVATRPTASSPWSTPQPAAALAATFATVSPYVQGDGSYLYFSSSRIKESGDAGVDAGADAGPFNLGGYDIYRVPLSAGQPSGPIEHVPELSTPGDDMSPVVTPDGKTIYFSRGIGSDGGTAFRQIWTATRDTVPGPFGTPNIVAELEHDTATTDPTWVSPGNCTLYFASFRGTEESGGERVFVAARPAQ